MFFIKRITNILNNKIKFNFDLKNNLHNHHIKKYKKSYVSSTSHTPLLSETIGERLEYAAEKFGDREAFVFGQTGERITFKNLKIKAEDLATGLLAIGLNKGNRVGIWAPNCSEWIITQYATALAGIIQVNINPAYKTYELEYSLNKVGCKSIILSETYKTQNYVDMLLTVCPEITSHKPGSDLNSKRLPKLKSAILLGNTEYDGFYSYNQLSNGGDSIHKYKLENLKKDIQTSDPINIQYTSGTTGSPKGVTLTHHMILNNAYFTALSQDYHKNETKICLMVPLYHCFGMVLGSLSTICHGITCCLPSPLFNPEESLKMIEKEKCTTLYGTPTMYIDLYNHPNFSKYNISSINGGLMAGSTCPVEIVNNCVKKLNAKNIAVVYGMTETSPLVTLSYAHDSLEHRTQTIGKTKEHVETKVVDQEGRIVPVNHKGELLVRGYNTMLGYWGDEDKTKEIYTHDRFLKTGDIVCMDEKGFFHHQGRLKDVVIRGGENIYPKELEEFLHQNPKIADVYVIGIPDKRMGEELCACVKLAHNQTMTAEELKSFCKDKISHFKIPRYVEFMNEFPTTVTGKVKKNVLREIVTKKLKI